MSLIGDMLVDFFQTCIFERGCKPSEQGSCLGSFAAFQHPLPGTVTKRLRSKFMPADRYL